MLADSEHISFNDLLNNILNAYVKANAEVLKILMENEKKIAVIKAKAINDTPTKKKRKSKNTKGGVENAEN